MTYWIFYILYCHHYITYLMIELPIECPLSSVHHVSQFIYRHQQLLLLSFSSVWTHFIHTYKSTIPAINYQNLTHFFNYCNNFIQADDPEHHDESFCGKILIFLSWFLICITMPFSLLVCFKVSEFILIKLNWNKFVREIEIYF